MDELNRPKVGIGVIIVRNGKVLLGKRKSVHGKGSWGFPGGHLEYGESFEDCARREVFEECGVEIENLRKGPYTNDVFEQGKHYVTLFMIADWQAGQAEVKEPHKCERWQWFEWDNLARPRFLPLENLLRQNYSPFIGG